MEKTTTPEIMRAPLERTVLQAKMLELNETPAQILALALSPPNLGSIQSTIWQLKEVRVGEAGWKKGFNLLNLCVDRSFA